MLLAFLVHLVEDFVDGLMSKLNLLLAANFQQPSNCIKHDLGGHFSGILLRMSGKSLEEVPLVFADSLRRRKDTLLDKIEHSLVRLGQDKEQNVGHVLQFFIGRGIDHQVENDSINEFVSHLKYFKIFLRISAQILLGLLDAYLQEL